MLLSGHQQLSHTQRRRRTRISRELPAPQRRMLRTHQERLEAVSPPGGRGRRAFGKRHLRRVAASWMRPIGCESELRETLLLLLLTACAVDRRCSSRHQRLLFAPHREPWEPSTRGGGGAPTQRTQKLSTRGGDARAFKESCQLLHREWERALAAPFAVQESQLRVECATAALQIAAPKAPTSRERRTAREHERVLFSLLSGRSLLRHIEAVRTHQERRDAWLWGGGTSAPRRWRARPSPRPHCREPPPPPRRRALVRDICSLSVALNAAESEQRLLTEPARLG